MERSRLRQLRYAKDMRRNPTWSEFRLWQALKGKALGVKFRRQHPIGPYIVDFVCLSHRIVVQADEVTHDDIEVGYAGARERFLRSRGFTVLRIDDNVVNHAIEYALAMTRHALDECCE